MIGMGDDKKIGSLLIAIGGGLKPEKKEDPYDGMVDLCAERVMEAIKSGDAKALIKELPKLIAVLPSADFSGEDEEID